ncbi:MAG: hypothetical protein FWD13_01815 [Treponema sp.]|nr:hypothetical protein [Treponema sp.]
MNKYIKFNEDEQIIGTPQYEVFQRMCTEAGLFAIKEAKDRGLPITYVENEEIVKEYSDGRKEILGRIKPAVPVTKRIYKIK